MKAKRKPSRALTPAKSDPTILVTDLRALIESARTTVARGVNVAMVMGAIPVGGVPLPLVSHGGSAMIMVMIAFGVLMSVYVHRDVEFSDGRDDG